MSALISNWYILDYYYYRQWCLVAEPALLLTKATHWSLDRVTSATCYQSTLLSDWENCSWRNDRMTGFTSSFWTRNVENRGICYRNVCPSVTSFNSHIYLSHRFTGSLIPPMLVCSSVWLATSGSPGQYTLSKLVNPLLLLIKREQCIRTGISATWQIMWSATSQKIIRT